jgi:hypothetical protein
MSTEKDNVFAKASRERNSFTVPKLKIEGRVVEPDSNSITLYRGYQKIDKIGGISKVNNLSEAGQRVDALLEALGCSVCFETKEFTLLESQTDEEIIDNENIIDSEKLAKEKNKNETAEDKFPNSADPFFTFDESIPNTTKQQTHSINSMDLKPNLEQLAIELILVNLSPNGTTTKYFM